MNAFCSVLRLTMCLGGAVYFDVGPLGNFHLYRLMFKDTFDEYAYRFGNVNRTRAYILLMQTEIDTTVDSHTLTSS